MNIKEVLDTLECFAPLPLQEGWDNAGLQLGLTEAEVSGVLLCLDVSENTVDEAIRKGCNLIVSHHPLIFHGLKTISDGNYVQRTVMKAIKNDIVIASMHTNLDNAQGGVNYKIAEKLNLDNVRFLAAKNVDGIECGSGVVGILPQALSARDFIETVKKTFAVEYAQCNQLLTRPIKTVAICGGAGDFLIDEAIAANADAFITGEMHYHVYFGHEQEIQICVIGHYQSEQYTSEIFESIIREKCEGVNVLHSNTSTNPIIYI